MSAGGGVGPAAPADRRAVDRRIGLLPTSSRLDDFVLVREAGGVSGRGVHRRIRVDAGPEQPHRAAQAAGDLLAATHRRDAVVVGALPFTGDVPALLTIPARTLIRDPEGQVSEVTLDAAWTLPVPAHPGAEPALAGAPQPPDATHAQYTAAVREALRRIDAGDLLAATHRRDAVVVGALPFAGDVPALLTIPTRTLIRDPEGQVSEVTLDGAWNALPEPAHPGAEPTLAGAPQPPDATHAQYTAAVREALRRIDAGDLRKVVLARSRTVAAPTDLAAVLRRLAARDPRCHVFAAAIPGPGVVAGATPELLVRRRGDLVFSTPLAGSAARGADPASDRDAAERLMASVKDRAEHRLVVEAVADALAPLCRDLRVDPQPSMSGTATVWHLSTNLRGVLRNRDLSALALAAHLHPTPAVCGVPRDIARGVIDDLETVPRGFYAGLVGWVDGSGDGEWAITLRCAEIRAGAARLFAGAGIIAGSDPEAEFAETEIKFRALAEGLTAAL